MVRLWLALCSLPHKYIWPCSDCQHQIRFLAYPDGSLNSKKTHEICTFANWIQPRFEDGLTCAWIPANFWVWSLISDFKLSFASFAMQHTTTTSKYISSRAECMRSLAERVNSLRTVKLKLIVCFTAWQRDCLKSELMDEWFLMLPRWKHT